MKCKIAVRRISWGLLMAAIAHASPTLAANVGEPTEIPIERSASLVQGHPLTSVVVTQCNLIVAVYMTMADGRLLRFDKAAGIPAQQLLQAAYAATRSERVELSCAEEGGAVGYERHDPL